jgi:hypothetical protein
LIWAEADIAARWMGIDGLSTHDRLQKSDYERACSTAQYLETMACDAGYVLILGDEPLQSSVFRTDGGDVAVARWVYAQSSEGVEKFLGGGCGHTLAPAVHFGVLQGPLVLFDASLRGMDALACCPKSDVRPGSYCVTTERWQLGKEFNFIVHRLTAE